MSVLENDKKTIAKIIEYCLRITNTVERFGDSWDSFCSDCDYQNSICMSILQIGEFAGKPSDEFKEEYPDTNWRAIRGMRNIFAHDYGSMDLERTWDTVKCDIPALKEYCETLVSKL